MLSRSSELVRWIRNLPDDYALRGGRRIKDVPIVMQSGNRSAGKVTDFAPDVPLLWKPYKFQALLDAMDSAVPVLDRVKDSERIRQAPAGAEQTRG